MGSFSGCDRRDDGKDPDWNRDEKEPSVPPPAQSGCETADWRAFANDQRCATPNSHAAESNDERRHFQSSRGKTLHPSADHSKPVATRSAINQANPPKASGSSGIARDSPVPSRTAVALIAANAKIAPTDKSIKAV